MGETLDELLYKSYKDLLNRGKRISPTKGECLEIRDAVLKLKNPRARFSSTKERGATLFSGLGEMLWCFSGSDKLDFIEYYIPKYWRFINAKEDSKIASGAYGPRLFGSIPTNKDQGELFSSCQVQRAIEQLKTKSNTRQAIIQVFREGDLEESKGDVPCTCTIQLLCRKGKLHMITYMRSNDAYRGLPHDIFVFTFLQEYTARTIGSELGEYSHHVGSFHLYTDNKSDKDKKTDIEKVKEFLKEKPSEKIAMPLMPEGDP